MNEIRNLTRNGETFYPLTVVEAVSDPEGEYIGYYTDNPEWIRVILDNDKKVLAGIKADGSIEWSIGVPQPVKDYIQENIIPVLADKVDKEEGKSLIDSEYSQSISIQNNPEFLEIKMDSNERIIEATYKDGTKIYSQGIQTKKLELDSAVVYSIKNPEFLSVWVDESENLISAIKKNGDIYFGYGIPTQISETFGKYINNTEFIKIEIDSDERIIEATYKDGTKVFFTGIETDSINLSGNFLTCEKDLEGRVDIHLDSEDKILSYRRSDGTLVENAGIETTKLGLTRQGMTDFQQALKDSGFTPGGGGDWSDRDTIELPEPKHYSLLNIDIDYLPIISGDVRGATIQYYDGLGNSFKMSAEIEIQGQTSRVFALNGGKGNYTLDLPKDIKFGHWVPQDSFHLKGCAKDVVRGILPTSYKWAYLMQEYLGSKPNRVLVDESGITTTHATGERINDWPTDARCLPDGFPCELYVNGEYHGLYSWQLKKHRKNYSMNKKDYTSFFLDADQMMSSDEKTGIWNEGPDGINLKTNKSWWTGFDIKGPNKLVVMDGSEFDGDHPQELIGPRYEIRDITNWLPASEFSKTEPPSDIWNSQTTYSIGQECWCYDEELEGWTKFKAIQQNLNHQPLIFNENSIYDSNIKEHKGSYTTKKLIRQMSTRYLEIKSLINSDHIEDWVDSEDVHHEGAKTVFNKYFDYDACMLVYIYNCLMKNYDSIKKNTLWGMYGSGKIFPALWDLDGMYGTGWIGNGASTPTAYLWYVMDPNQKTYANSEWPLALFWSLYESEIKETYANLRINEIISISTWHNIMFDQWVNRIGEDAYNRDIERWPETPSYRENYTNTEYWTELGFLGEGSETKTVWNNQDSYNTGDVVIILGGSGSSWYDQYRAKKPSDSQNPQCPVTKFYEKFPIVGGFYDSPKRMENWMREQIHLCDVALGYNN